MGTYGLSTGIFIALSIYGAVLFCVTLYKPKIGLFLIVPIIGLGFSESSIIKGAFVGVFSIAALIHVIATRKIYPIPKTVMPLLLIVFGFICWVFIRSIIGDESLSFWAFWILKRLLTPAALAFFVFYFIRTEQEVISFIWALCGFAVFTATFGIFQYFSSLDFFWYARELLGVPSSIAYQIIDKVRIPGLSSYVVPLSYQLLSVFPLVLSLLAIKSKKISHPATVIIALSTIFLCLVFTFMKSGIAAAVLGSFVVYICLVRFRILRLGRSLFMSVAFISILFFILFTSSISKQIFSLGDTSYERLPIALAALKVLGVNPLGVGYGYTEAVKEIYPEIHQLVRSEAALVQFPHNLLLNISVILGLPALVLVVLFYSSLLHSLYRVVHIRTTRLRILVIGLIGSFVAYLFNVMFHNNSPFFGDTFNWFIIGLALAAINIGYHQNTAQVVPVEKKVNLL